MTATLLNTLADGRDTALRVDAAADLFISVDLATPCGLIVNKLVTYALKEVEGNPIAE